MDTLALILAIIGAVNWGLVGFARFDLVAWIFGGQTASVSRIIYAVVGLAGLWCISLPDRLPIGKIPVVGVVTAGVPILAVENIEGYLPWDGDESCFALRVRGDSMINAGILSGDKVVVRPQKTAENGQIVVALLDDSATVKRFHREKGKVWLLPENPAYEPIDGTDCSILGLVKAVVREY